MKKAIYIGFAAYNISCVMALIWALGFDPDTTSYEMAMAVYFYTGLFFQVTGMICTIIVAIMLIARAFNKHGAA